MISQPTGIVTLLFTDIEGSTKLLDRLGAERYAAVLERHRVLLREPFARRDGFEFGTEGDACFVAFASASDGSFVRCSVRAINTASGASSHSPMNGTDMAAATLSMASRSARSTKSN